MYLCLRVLCIVTVSTLRERAPQPGKLIKTYKYVTTNIALHKYSRLTKETVKRIKKDYNLYWYWSLGSNKYVCVCLCVCIP
jgi:hypothetical protein